LRGLRVEYSGAVAHVINRGDRREAIVRDDGDRQRLLETPAERAEADHRKAHIARQLRRETSMTLV
jgi:hypothetical protein